MLSTGLDYVLETPRGTLREILSARRRTSVPIILDELIHDTASIVQVITDDAADGIGPRISGGLTPGRRQRICASRWAHAHRAGHDRLGHRVYRVGPRGADDACTVPEMSELREMVSKTTVETPIPLLDGRGHRTRRSRAGGHARDDVLCDPVATDA